MNNSNAASVRARLLNLAKAQGVDFNQVLIRFALERILYRMSKSAYADRFLRKGALLFTLWYDMPHRATRDADLLGFGPSDLEAICQYCWNAKPWTPKFWPRRSQPHSSDAVWQCRTRRRSV